MKTVTRADLLSVRLPQYTGNSYTVVPHFKALGTLQDCLELNKLQVRSEKLFMSSNGQIAGGQLTLELEVEKDSECIITFLNSYNKQRAFNTKSAIRMVDSGNIMVLNESKSNFRRVHKGLANEVIETNMCETLKTIEEDFRELVKYKNILKDIKLNNFEVFNCLGQMFFDEQILNSEQMNYVKEQLNNPEKYVYNYCNSSAFWLYMLASSAIENRGNAVDAYSQAHTKLNKYFVDKFKKSEPMTYEEIQAEREYVPYHLPEEENYYSTSEEEYIPEYHLEASYNQ